MKPLMLGPGHLWVHNNVPMMIEVHHEMDEKAEMNIPMAHLAARIIASLDYMSADQYTIHFINHFIC